jgi:hypothetical protein
MAIITGICIVIISRREQTSASSSSAAAADCLRTFQKQFYFSEAEVGIEAPFFVSWCRTESFSNPLLYGSSD